DEPPQFKDAGEMRAWLWTAAWRLLIDRTRGRGRDAVPLSQAHSADMGLALAGGGGVSAAMRSERDAALNVVMNLLRDDDREVLELVYFQHLDVEALTKRLGISRAAAEMRLSRARRRLGEKMLSWADVV